MKPRSAYAAILALCITLAAPAAGDETDQSKCLDGISTSETIGDTGLIASVQGDECATVSDKIRRAEDAKQARDKKIHSEAVNTKRTTLVSGCYRNLGEPGLETCAQQEEAFCPGEDSTWVMPETTDTANPDANPTYGTRQCTDAATAGSTPSPGTPAQPAVSVNDMAELFAPDPQIESDNGGRGVRNAETNFYTSTEMTTKRTTLNGEPVDLRLTPITFTWTYGDGSAPVTTVNGGTSQSEFNAPTPTSHVYTETGQYQVELTTVFVGEVRYEGGDWQPVDGTITRTAQPVTADIWRTVTKNVAEDCSADPSAWGCTGPIDATQNTAPATD
jgi:hypothetical protein